ncbi:MAG: hypothetical protein E6K81_11410 [Candidatus Eisenbacteria bacterium]|uniref:Uncharacterized protein n=1 Tax=Eiseniibacteriota bacterium TaxID=2212470 RepID=A0A538U4S2_UNCEI|nr:MAG: hypothetical protein E6K81_11410 [Candidatus Eisenbacteria bacterium]
MVKGRAFFHVCAGLFLLALSYHLGARNATAQAAGGQVAAMAGISSGGVPIWLVATPDGDIYSNLNPHNGSPWTRQANVFTGGPTPVQPST